tara:strand:- start:52078 stop:52365 length:288 start_codon:yes stop_codon:yes gene_type:complete
MKKQIGIGFITGLIANTIGIILCTLIVSSIKGTGMSETLNFYIKSGNLWTILTLGALPNLAVFFGFLKFDREYNARGVVMATFITAIAAYVIYFN